MKYTIHILLATMMMSCTQNSTQSEAHDIPNQTEAPRATIKDTFDFYSDDILTHIDAEALCEFSFDFFMPQLNQILSETGLRLDVKTAQDYDESFAIEINGNRVKLYTNRELEDGTFWDKGARNFFWKVNEVVLSSGIEEKFYLLYSGNDLSAIFLSEDKFNDMAEINKDNKNEIPYLP